MDFKNRKFSMEQRQIIWAIITAGAVVVLFHLQWYRPAYLSQRERYTKFNDCIKKEIDGMNAETFWEKCGAVANSCEPLLELTTPRLQGFRNNDETKYHILPIDKSEKSTIVTLGIGGDAEAEKKLKLILSEDSVFIGVDPSITNHDVYRQVGTFLPMSIGKDSGSVTIDHLVTNGTYGTGNTFMITLTTLIREYLPRKTKMIDDIWVDIEYSEYKMLDLFYNSAELFQQGYSLCQFNVEVHGPNDEQKEIFYNFIKQLLADERFAFVKVTWHWQHWRIFFVDYLDRTCAERYLLGM